MKTVVADYRYRVVCMRIEPVAAAHIYLTNYTHDLVMGGHTYTSMSGYEFTGYNSTVDFSPAAIDLEGIAGVAGLSRAAIMSGLFDGARYFIFATDWTSPLEDEEEIVAGLFGKATLIDDRYRISGVSLIDVLGQNVGDSYGAQCPKKFCGTEYAGCGLSLAANTVTGTITHVTSASIVRDSARGEAADVFGAGTIQITSGTNAGTKPIEIRSHAADGTIEVHESFYYLPSVGDTYSMVRGCRKRLVDCQNRLGGSNVLNYGGDLWIPSGSTYAHVGKSG